MSYGKGQEGGKKEVRVPTSDKIQNISIQFLTHLIMTLVKFIYSEKATKFCEISTLILSVCTVDKSKVEILQKFVAFSEYRNSTSLYFNFSV